ncbi:MAG: PD40 domain-containing protein [Parachlamydiaceae bacterium]|nr:PD40 domain-containing protein [Parachlamydiaceae bacterium]
MGRLTFKVFIFIFLSTFTLNTHAEIIYDSNPEAVTLRNVKQLTFPSMGFEKAGEAYFSPDMQYVIFQAVPNGQKHYQIYVMNIEGGIPRMVSTGRGACTCAYFRPDGKKIIFASSHSDPMLLEEEKVQAVPGYKRDGKQYVWEFTPYMNIYEANPDGSDLTALTTGPEYHAECAYSPDGSRIVFACNKTGSMNLYTMKSDGTDIQQVTHTTNSYNGGPFYSPDGQYIIFRADREKPHYLQIYTIMSDGTNEQQVTNNGAVNWAPYWHPIGNVFAFTTSIHGHFQYEIYAQNLSTGVQYRLTYNPTFDGLPVFSNDGFKLLWTSKRGPDKTCQLFIADFFMPLELK